MNEFLIALTVSSSIATIIAMSITTYTVLQKILVKKICKNLNKVFNLYDSIITHEYREIIINNYKCYSKINKEIDDIIWYAVQNKMIEVHSKIIDKYIYESIGYEWWNSRNLKVFREQLSNINLFSLLSINYKYKCVLGRVNKICKILFDQEIIVGDVYKNYHNKIYNICTLNMKFFKNTEIELCPYRGILEFNKSFIFTRQVIRIIKRKEKKLDSKDLMGFKISVSFLDKWDKLDIYFWFSNKNKITNINIPFFHIKKFFKEVNSCKFKVILENTINNIINNEVTGDEEISKCVIISLYLFFLMKRLNLTIEDIIIFSKIEYYKNNKDYLIINSNWLIIHILYLIQNQRKYYDLFQTLVK